MNIETLLPSDLWQAVRENFEKRDFTAAILDCCYFVSELIRQKSGIDGDGAALIGQALGGGNPKIKIAKDQSENEQNIQKGIESILRGFYQAIRNPRSHKKISDSADDAISIILFCGYIVRQIDKAKTPTSKEAFVQRILDPDFVHGNRYAELLVHEIPPGLRIEVLLDLLKQVETWNPKSVRFFIEQIIPVMRHEDKAAIVDFLSEEFKLIDNEIAIRNFVYCFPIEIWNEVSEIGRLRLENKVIRSFSGGRFDKKSRNCSAGSMATWARAIIPHFHLKREFLSALCSKLNSKITQERDYALHFFVDTLIHFEKADLSFVESIFTRKLTEGISAFYDALIFSPWSEKYWGSPLKQAFDKFSAKEATDLDDEIPF